MRACFVCQLDKIEQCLPQRKPKSLLIPSRPCESSSMDFILGLPKVGELGSIFVVVDRFPKHGIFIPAPKNCNAEMVAQLFVAKMMKYWGVP